MPGPTLDLSGQVAVVTGASSGIGAAVAAALGAAGAKVVVNYRGDRDGADQTAEKIRQAGSEALVVEADVSSEADVERLFAETRTAFGTLHLLVANAGVQQDAPADAMTLDQWRKVIDINLTGQFLCCRAAIREFLARGPLPAVSRATGKIICMSSVHEKIMWAGHVNYAASKGGVMLMMQSLAQEFADRKIRINSIAPGAIRTPINREAWETPEALAKLLKLIPYGRIGEPEDIANAALWLASDLSDYVTGATLFVDGGMTLYPEFREGG
ncbi:SDR family oxidoreductase [Enterovirga sp.]|jgi:glucose 1-dehydrogenase|uniref:SDR family oxidoreductase n=1 Tax=Enterovirga sp. TaxID=2026350 RepID=UPI002620A701|nr:SDR family oxidoreductase [Enterovirga sp.]MDB5589906.1 glucose 1-dehydrogenase [Enterovirga sp.]